ncbi:MAG TPA: hypothetical protein VHJ83_07855 [Micromonosporaceae bacterium]|nr:hypothetical protein [Micromonosporaceae bacterium]
MDLTRRMWALFESIHTITYSTPESQGTFEAVGLHGYWRGYFASRVAPMGAASAPLVVATLFFFAPSKVEQFVPEVWQRVTPEQALRARSEGATAALKRLTADLPVDRVTEAADILTEAASRLETAGRVLGAANAAIPVPDEPLPRIWQATTTLREHRLGGHIAAWVAAGVDGCEGHVFRAAYDLHRRVLQARRGWDDEEWEAATKRMIESGWLDSEGAPTEWGLARYEEIEVATNRAAASAWAGFDPERLEAVLTPLARICRAEMPAENPIGLPHKL